MKKQELTIVGIGASAGGLEALQGFVSNLPTGTSIAYLLAQHLSPTYKSMMVDLLAKNSTIEIREAKNQDIIKADTLYICPPNKNIIIEGESIIIMEAKQLTYGPKPSVNILFESIAANKESKAIGIILSGTGSDGSAGIRAIKAEGGFTIVQQPRNAKYDGMPNSAINTGNVDLILDVEVMGNEIVELLKYPDRAVSLNNIDNKAKLYNSIIDKLRKSKKIDFSLYKSSTIQRRIERRIIALRLKTLEEYYNYLSLNNNEVEELFKDILIGVTSFFRDEEAFAVLKNTIKEMMEKKKDSNIRFWIPGCSTGEEVYTIAMILSEVLGGDILNYKIQIFATDIDDRATKYARIGRYPESSLMNVEKHYVKKYFTVKNDEYEIIKPIREMCIFSKHDITNDPAFMRLDLISCRNLLIYFTTELQAKIFPMFHYSLNDDGTLFLGKSESIGNFNHQFKILDKRWKLYRALYLGKKSTPLPLKSFESKDMKDYDRPIKTTLTSNAPTISDMMITHIQRHIIPMCIVVNDTYEMIFIKGNNPFLQRPDGEISQNIFKNVIDELSIEMRANFHQAKKEAKTVKTQFIKVFLNTGPRYVRLIISPLDNVMNSNLYMVCFQEESLEHIQGFTTNMKNSDSHEEFEKIELELARTKEHLQTVIEELETSNEEMQSLNEELQSSNEELQSSNEELETTNEELQSTNEELQTAYTEMRAMYEERDTDATEINNIRNYLETTNQRLSTVLDSSKIGIYDVDITDNQTLYINDKFAEVFGFHKDELKNEKNIFTWCLSRTHADHKTELEQNLDQLILGRSKSFKLEFQVLHKTGKKVWVECFASAIVDEKTEKIVRMVGTLSDIDEKKTLSIAKEILQSKFSDAVDMVNLGVWEWEVEKDELWWSDTMYKIFELPLDAKLNLNIIKECIVEEDRERHAQHLQKTLEENLEHNITFRIQTKQGIKKIWAKGKNILNENNKPYKMVGVLQNITQNYLKDIELEVKQQYIDSILHSSFNGVYIYNFSENLNTYVNPEYTNITGYTLEDLQSLSEDDFVNLFHKDDTSRVLEHISAIKNSDSVEPLEITYRFRHKEGHFITLLSRDAKVAKSVGELSVEMIGAFKEISEPKNEKTS